MCGIVGIFHFRGDPEVDRELIHRMNEEQYHRGPDQGGIYTEAGIGLGHRRLSIIDLTSGKQPLKNEDGSVVVVYNGEIYNFQALSSELVKYGHEFRTNCDTEVLVHAWEQWGPECVTRFRGMFAFAIWDRNKETLFLARDRLGIKPLHYAVLSNGELVFSSEIKALLQHPHISRALNPIAIEQYFALGYIADPTSIYQAVHKLPPGHAMVVKRGGEVSQPRQYWDIPYSETATTPENELAESLRERLSEAVRIRLVSDVPLGAFLSGGVDSSAIVAAMASELDEAVNTCSISFGERAYDEAQYASVVAAACSTNHYVEKVVSDDYQLVDTLSKIYDEPYADSSALPTYRLCEVTRKRVTVALSGDGGDENFLGYRSYRLHRNKERIRAGIPAPIRRMLFGVLGQVYPKADWAPQCLRARTTFQTLAGTAIESFAHGAMITAPEVRDRLFSAQMRRDLQGYSAVDLFREHARRAPTDDPLSIVQYLDMKLYLPSDILTKVDRASMAHGLEVRVPLLDHELVEWAANVPSALKLKGSEGKYIFKKALEKDLPPEILYRKKMGFSLPVNEWLRGPLRSRVRDAALGAWVADSGYFDMKQVHKMVNENERGLRNHSDVLWALMLFDAFLRRQ